MTITAAQQFRAIAYLRWCLFKNSFRRKDGAGELVARILLYPIFALFIIGPVIGAFTLAYTAVHSGHLGPLSLIFWGIFVLQVIVSVNLGQPGLSFDPEQLIRFPLTFTRYLIVRLFLGLLAASTVIGTLALLAAAAGVTVAQPGLAVAAFAAALSLAVCNLLFLRMVFAWVDRWLATRRAREIFTGLIIFLSLGVQYLNFTYNPAFHRGHGTAHSASQIATASRLYHAAEPLLNVLPPGLARLAVSSAAGGRTLAAIGCVLGILLFGAAFLAVFAWRMQREYRGENLSEANQQTPIPTATTAVAVPRVAAAVSTVRRDAAAAKASSPLQACLAKEWIYLRRNTTQLYGLLAPLAMVLFFTLRMRNGFTRGDYFFPSAVLYSILGIAALAYNSFGLDATGIQFYLLAPVSLGTVMLAKNLWSFAVGVMELLLVLALIVYSAGWPPVPILLGTICWAVFASLINVTVGNRRSITSPKKMDPSKMSKRQASQLSALMALGIMLALAAVGAGLLLASVFLDLPWLPAGVFAVLAIGAGVLYRTSLRGLDALSYKNRESMLEELCKAS